MLRILFRWSAYALLAGAMALGIIDGARSLSGAGLEMTRLGGVALQLFPRQFPLLEPAVSRLVHPQAWDPLLLNLFMLPAIAVFFALGGLLLYVGQPRAPAPIGG